MDLENAKNARRLTNSRNVDCLKMKKRRCVKDKKNSSTRRFFQYAFEKNKELLTNFSFERRMDDNVCDRILVSGPFDPHWNVILETDLKPIIKVRKIYIKNESFDWWRRHHKVIQEITYLSPHEPLIVSTSLRMYDRYTHLWKCFITEFTDNRKKNKLSRGLCQWFFQADHLIIEVLQK